jgi:P-type E1-E2 ATPase
MMLVGMCKEFAVEYKRFKDDSRVNAMQTSRMDPIAQIVKQNTKSSALTATTPATKAIAKGVSSFQQVPVSDIKVGDIVELKDDEQIPADCVILACDNKKGEVFV